MLCKWKWYIHTGNLSMTLLSMINWTGTRAAVKPAVRTHRVDLINLCIHWRFSSQIPDWLLNFGSLFLTHNHCNIPDCIPRCYTHLNTLIFTNNHSDQAGNILTNSMYSTFVLSDDKSAPLSPLRKIDTHSNLKNTLERKKEKLEEKIYSTSLVQNLL